MARRLMVIVALGLSLSMIGGCGGKKTQAAPQNDSDVPDFVLNPPKEKGAIFGTGIAEQASAQLAKEAADLRARKEIATILSSKVSSMFKDYLGQAGVGTEAEVTELTSSVTRSISEVELSGVIIEKRVYLKGKMYTLGKFALDDAMKKLVTGAVTNALTSKEALLSQFRAKQGFEDLDKQLDKMRESE